MRILFTMGHPAHFHLFKHAIRLLNARGHDCAIACIRKEVLLNLLDASGYSYTVIGNSSSTLWGKLIEQIKIEARLYQKVRDFVPDILIGGPGGVAVAHVGRLGGIPSVVFDDTEHARIEHVLMDPFVSTICTPSCYHSDLGIKQIRYNSYHQLASLHPNYFTPNPAVLTELGLDMSDNIFLIRFAAFKASHDTQSENFDKRYIPDLIHKLEDKGTIVISSEVKLESNLQKYEYKLAPEKYHDLLYYAKMYIGEGSTSAIEAAVLGTPAINFERIVSKGKKYSFADFSGVIAEFQDKYNLIHCYYDEVMMLEKIDEIISMGFDKVKMQAKENKERLLHDTIDVTSFMVWFIENYPESFNQMRENPEIQKRFSHQR